MDPPLESPNSSVQLASHRLVSSPSDTTHLFATASAQQQGAINILKDEDDKSISAWLTLARSLKRDPVDRSDHLYLTREQLRAIAALRHCKSSDVDAWLHQARIPGFKYQAATQHPSTQPWPTSTISSSQPKSKYCCTLCRTVRPFKNRTDWWKHEKEHDTAYICMLKGPREATAQGSQCAFCGIPNPEDVHFGEHNAQACHQGPPEPFSSKRRHELVGHIRKVHGIESKAQGEAIAVKWKNTIEKKAWSCGFCVTTFPSFSERLSHITTQHFERGQTILDWDATKVIQGLLRQPGMIEAWEGKLMSLLSWQVENITWEKDAIIDLQHDLEVGPNEEKSATNLAEAAYIACRLNRGMDTEHVRADSGAVSDQMLGATATSPNQLQALSAFSPNFGSNRYQPLSAVQGLNNVSGGGLATQAGQGLDYDYSSVPMANFYDSNDMSLDASPSIFSKPT